MEYGIEIDWCVEERTFRVCILRARLFGDDEAYEQDAWMVVGHAKTCTNLDRRIYMCHKL